MVFFTKEHFIKKKKRARGGRVNITILLHPGKANPVRLSLQEAVRPFHPVISCKHSPPSGSRPLFPAVHRSHFPRLMFYTHSSDTMQTRRTPQATGHSFILNQKCHPWQPEAAKHLLSLAFLALGIISFMPDSQITIWQASLGPRDH